MKNNCPFVPYAEFLLIGDLKFIYLENKSMHSSYYCQKNDYLCLFDNKQST